MVERSEQRNRRLERIKQAVDDGDDLLLTDEEKKEKMQLLAAASMMMEPQRTLYGTVQNLVKEYGITERVAYRRIEDVPLVLGSVFGKTDRTWAKLKAVQRAEAAYSMAMSNKDLDAALKANDQLIKLHALDREDQSRIDPTKLEPHQYKLTFGRRSQQLLKKLMESGVVDISEMLEKAGAIVDVEAEVVDGGTAQALHARLDPLSGDEEEDDDPAR